MLRSITEGTHSEDKGHCVRRQTMQGRSDPGAMLERQGLRWGLIIWTSPVAFDDQPAWEEELEAKMIIGLTTFSNPH